ncbi:zeta toxin family protein [Gilvimarinus chinensis]|uniref:zeta toxin family protein n=1 Tax=Gilvimarinus chinensis TaxID=396005 RepID=UPI00035C3286|nr:zeta toxin family protein [Gilvimarinus chinensis]
MDENKDRPEFHMLAGPNGAGKSTLYKTVIAPRTKAPFINADEIQKNELPDTTEKGAYQAAIIAEERRQQHLKDGHSFVSESTFSHPSKVELVRKAKAQGFTVQLYHISLESAEKAVERVSDRVGKGGHPVPEDKIRGRYERNPAYIRQAAKESDSAFVFDNSVEGRLPELVVEMRNGIVVKASRDRPQWVEEAYKPDLEKWRSLESSHSQLSKTYGRNFKLGVAAGDSGARYKGEIIHDSDHYTIQKTNQGRALLKATAHDKSLLSSVPEVGSFATINYRGVGLASVKVATKNKGVGKDEPER